jgi:S1-C subfamily serine protease
MCRRFVGYGLRVLRQFVCLLLALALLLPTTSALGAAAEPEPDVRRDAVVIAVEKVLPCVVNIATETIIEYHDWYEDLFRQFYGRRSPSHQQRSISLGSGVIIDEDGYILTNSHVVRRATRIQVKLWDGREYEAEPIWFTQDSDLALLRIHAKPGEKFHAIKFAPADDLLLGETVIALGNPFGLGGSVTKGILSSKNRRPSTGNEPLNVEDWLQTDAAINPGNSGGPLVNLRGEVIGLNVAVYREETGERGMGVGFSIPVKQITATLSRRSTPEHTDGLWCGLQAKATAGALSVSSVQPGSPAFKAGLREADEILQVNGETPANLISFNRLLCSSTNQEPRLTISRGGERLSVRVRLLPFKEVVPQKLGLTLTAPTDQVLAGLNLKSGESLLIDSVEKNGPADKANLQRGFLVTGIEGQSVSDFNGVGEMVCAKKPGDCVQVTVIAPRRLGVGYVEFRQGTVAVTVR